MIQNFLICSPFKFPFGGMHHYAPCMFKHLYSEWKVLKILYVYKLQRDFSISKWSNPTWQIIPLSKWWITIVLEYRITHLGDLQGQPHESWDSPPDDSALSQRGPVPSRLSRIVHGAVMGRGAQVRGKRGSNKIHWGSPKWKIWVLV